MRKENIKKAHQIKKEIGRKYDNDPRGWHVSMSRDSENYLHSRFTHHNKFWIIKEFPLNPYQSIGVGTESKLREEKLSKIKSSVEFGLRPLPQSQMKTLLEGDSSIIPKILQNSPLASQKCSPLAVEGPISLSPKPLISRAQKKLDRKLRKNLRTLISGKYPEFSRSYR